VDDRVGGGEAGGAHGGVIRADGVGRAARSRLVADDQRGFEGGAVVGVADVAGFGRTGGAAASGGRRAGPAGGVGAAGVHAGQAGQGDPGGGVAGVAVGRPGGRRGGGRDQPGRQGERQRQGEGGPAGRSPD